MSEINPRIFERNVVYKLGLYVKQRFMNENDLSEEEFVRAAKEFCDEYDENFRKAAETDYDAEEFERIKNPVIEGIPTHPVTLAYRGLASTPQWSEEDNCAYGTLENQFGCWVYGGSSMQELEDDFVMLVNDCYDFWYEDHCREMRAEKLPIDVFGTPYREIVVCANPETDFWINEEAQRCNMPKSTIANALLAWACSRGVRLDLTEDFYREGDHYHYRIDEVDGIEFGNINGDTASVSANEFNCLRLDLAITWKNDKSISFSHLPNDRIIIETFLNAIARYREDPAWTELSKYAHKPLRGRFPRKDAGRAPLNKDEASHRERYKKTMVTGAVQLGIIPDESEDSVAWLINEIKKAQS